MANEKTLNQAISGGSPLLIDSAMGTSLLKKGMKAGTLSEEYNFENAQVVEEIHRLNVEAGVDIITTNTFGANRLKLSEKNFDVDITIKNAIEIAKRASSGKAWVAQDIGPIGKMLKPYGDLDEGEARDLFDEQIACGVMHNADLFLIETMFDLAELRIAAQQAKINGGGKPVFCSVSIQKKDKTLMGNSIEEVAKCLADFGVDAFGINCGFGPLQMMDLVDTLKSATGGKMRSLMQPNAGLPKIDEHNQVYYDMQADEYTKLMIQIYESGISILGGCCGTSPEYLIGLRKQMGSPSWM